MDEYLFWRGRYFIHKNHPDYTEWGFGNELEKTSNKFMMQTILDKNIKNTALQDLIKKINTFDIWWKKYSNVIKLNKLTPENTGDKKEIV